MISVLGGTIGSKREVSSQYKMKAAHMVCAKNA